MNMWWNGLDTFQKVLYCIAVPSTLLLVVQTILVLCGFGHGGEGVDISDTSGIDFCGADAGGAAMPGDMPGADFGGIHSVSDVNVDGMNDLSGADGVNAVHDANYSGDIAYFRLFTLQTVVAFLCVFGWTSIVMYASVGNVGVSCVVGILFGGMAMVAIAKLVQQTAKLACSGTYIPANAVGLSGTVYIPVPASRHGSGKVNVIVQGRLMECDAITNGENMLSTNTQVKVTGVVGDTLVVEAVE